MLKIKRLYSQPNIFNEINFHDGINIIVGERVEQIANEQISKRNKKTNGVGKSLSIEFINFCLLKSGSSSRALRIPKDSMPDDVTIMLDIIFFNREITIARSLSMPTKPIITINNASPAQFDNLDDALDMFNNLIVNEYREFKGDIPSFRQLIGPLIRDEESEFRDVLKCYSLQDRGIDAPTLAKPHLFLFNIDPAFVDRIKLLTSQYEDENSYKNKMHEVITKKGERNITTIKSEINELESEVKKINTAIDDLKTYPAFKTIETDLMTIERDIDSYRSKLVALNYEIRNIELLPKFEQVNVKEVEDLYNIFEKGLGTHIKKNLDEVILIKEKIDTYQKKLLNEKLEQLKKLRNDIYEKLEQKEVKKTGLLKILEADGTLKDLKQGLLIQKEKSEELITLKSNYKEYEKAQDELQKIKFKRDKEFIDLTDAINEVREIIESFNETIVTIHDFIMDFGKASFSIVPNSSISVKTNFLSLDMRTQDDGGHSGNRSKVFIYDLALLENEYTRDRHLGFLVHDNILEVDQNTLIESLNYLQVLETKLKGNFQYILTLNKDKIENEEARQEIKLQIEDNVVARFTKKDKFLGRDYQEV